MSDDAQVLVAVDVPAAEAGPRAEQVVDWLVAAGIVERELTECVLGGAGRAPGNDFAEACASRDDERLALTRALGVNGMAVRAGRAVFDTGENGIELSCDACGRDFEPDVGGWQETVGAWWDGEDDAAYPCPLCGAERRLVDWDGPWAWGFAHLGFEFWNWPALSPTLSKQIARQVGGRVRVVRCRR